MPSSLLSVDILNSYILEKFYIWSPYQKNSEGVLYYIFCDRGQLLVIVVPATSSIHGVINAYIVQAFILFPHRSSKKQTAFNTNIYITKFNIFLVVR